MISEGSSFHPRHRTCTQFDANGFFVLIAAVDAATLKQALRCWVLGSAVLCAGQKFNLLQRLNIDADALLNWLVSCAELYGLSSYQRGRRLCGDIARLQSNPGTAALCRCT